MLEVLKITNCVTKQTKHPHILTPNHYTYTGNEDQH